MSESAARKWLIISALSVFGIWWYRRWREGPAVVLEAPKFVAAWGTVFFVLSLITEANPGFGGSFSILVMVGDLLGNALPKSGKGGILQDITGQQTGKAATGSALGGWDTVVAPASPVVGAGTVKVPSPGAGKQGAAAVGEQAGSGITAAQIAPLINPL